MSQINVVPVVVNTNVVVNHSAPKIDFVNYCDKNGNWIKDTRTNFDAKFGTSEINVFQKCTPAWCQEVIDNRNIDNRHIHNRNVIPLVNAIDTGKYMAACSTILFDNEGKLLDGQNRLSAIIQSGKTVAVWIRYGLLRNDDVISAIDLVRRRSAANIVDLMPHNDFSKDQLSAVAFLQKMNGDEYKLCFANKIELPKQIRDALNFGDEVTLTGVGLSPVRAVFSRAYEFYPDETDRLREAVEIMNGGTPNGEDDSAIYVLFKELRAKRNRWSGTEVRSLYRKTEKAISLFMDRTPYKGRKMKEANTELFLFASEGGSPRRKKNTVKP